MDGEKSSAQKWSRWCVCRWSGKSVVIRWCLSWSLREAGAVPCWLASWGRSVQAGHWSVLFRLEKEPRNQGGKGEWVHEGVQKRGQEMRWEPGLGNVVHWGKDFYFCHSDLGSDGEFWVDLCLKESLETLGGEGLEEGSLVDLGQILDVFMENRVYRMCGWVWIRKELCLDPRFLVWANGQMHLSSHANFTSHICHIWHWLLSGDPKAIAVTSSHPPPTPIHSLSGKGLKQSGHVSPGHYSWPSQGTFTLHVTDSLWSCLTRIQVQMKLNNAFKVNNTCWGDTGWSVDIV